MTTRYKILAVNSDTDTCECCGRKNLKKVAWVSEVVDGIEHDPAPYGTTCAAKAVAAHYGGDEYKIESNIHQAKTAIKTCSKYGQPTTVLNW
jgi:hypothetical protein